MTRKAALKTAGISMAGFQPRAKVFDGQTPPCGPAAATEAAREMGKPFTGVGSVMAAITREAEIAHELAAAQVQLTEARQALSGFEGAQLVRALDARAVRRSRWANRVELEFDSPEFQRLKDDISQAGGNVQPIKVRLLETTGANGRKEVFDGQTPHPASGVFDGQTPLYEIVYGHRRHQACLELGLPVQAVVAQHMDDRALFEAMDRENRSRKNLSAWEQGRMYDEALKNGLYPSLRRLAESLGVNLSDASRAVQLARLPAEIVAAFGSPLNLQVRWAKPLADALQRDPDSVLARARLLAAPAPADAALPRPGAAAAEVVARLLGEAPKPRPFEAVLKSGRRALATLRSDAQGRTTIDIPPGVLPAGRQEALSRLLKAFLSEQAAD